MAKLDRAIVVSEALDLLDAVGLNAISTRALARRLGVEQPSLYWHFRKKEELLDAMADAAMAPHATAALPTPDEDWREWFLENTHSFRRTLLLRRDGARLHAGSSPGSADRERIAHKMAFLTASGVPERPAMMAMLAAGRFTVGCVLEEQAEQGPPGIVLPIDHQSAFDAGLALIVAGLAQQATQKSSNGAGARAVRPERASPGAGDRATPSGSVSRPPRR